MTLKATDKEKQIGDMTLNTLDDLKECQDLLSAMYSVYSCEVYPGGEDQSEMLNKVQKYLQQKELI